VRYFLLFTVLIFSVATTKKCSDPLCFDETDEEICESFGTQCGVTVQVQDSCGKDRTVECECPTGKSCSTGSLKCD
jgi:hypothetical protein